MSFAWRLTFRSTTSSPRRAAASSSAPDCSRRTHPSIAFSGVRSSWESVGQELVLGAVRLLGPRSGPLQPGPESAELEPGRHVRQQLPGAERLHQVRVRTGFQPFDAGLLSRAG